jgi:hypothetical protein
VKSGPANNAVARRRALSAGGNSVKGQGSPLPKNPRMDFIDIQSN